MRILLYIFLLIIPLFANAQNDSDVHVSVDSERFADLVFDFPGGSEKNIGIEIDNQGGEEMIIRIRVDADEDLYIGSLVTGTRLYDSDSLQGAYDQISQNEHDVITFCRRAQEEAFKRWCMGKSEIDVVIDADAVVRVPMVVHIDANEGDHEAVLVIEREVQGEHHILQRLPMVYHAPNKGEINARLDRFALEKALGVWDFGAWLRSGMREGYYAHYVIQNTGTKDFDVVYRAQVRSAWIGEEVNFEQQAKLQYGGQEDVALNITMPRFGAVEVVGSVHFTDEHGNESNVKSEPIKLIVWPVKLVSLLVGSICFCIISVLLYTYIKKSMFGRKKGKKKIGAYSGEYVVQDADNIISIAQRYGVLWKELAEQNNIKSPYVLVSGEKIKVPEEAKESTEKEEELGGGIQQSVEESSMNEEEPQEMVGSAMKDDIEKPLESESAQAQVGGIQSKAEQDVPVQKKKTPSRPRAEARKMSSVRRKQDMEPKKVKRKVTFASPKNMLTKSSTQPTTRSIDLDWMKDDEDAYREEMYLQEKRVNKRFVAIIAVLVLVLAAGLWWGIMKFMAKDNPDTVSIDALIEEERVSSDDEGHSSDQSENEESADAQDAQSEESVDSPEVSEASPEQGGESADTSEAEQSQDSETGESVE